MEIKKDILDFNRKMSVYILDKTESTNDFCKELSFKTKEDALVIAFSQSKGKGRKGRTFFSPENSGIYMSLLLHPCLSSFDIIAVTLAAALSCCRAIKDAFSKECLIKWVNDIYWEDRKVGGILCESAFKGNENPDYVVVGIGVNLTPPKGGFPDEIKDKAGCLFDALRPSDSDITAFINLTVNYLCNYIDKLPDKSFMDDYRKLSFLKDKTVYFIKDGNQLSGKVLNIDDNGKIIIETKEETVSLFAGEVSLKF